MKMNVGNKDRALRMMAGFAIIAWGIATQNLWGAVGIVPLLTGLIGWCPAYVPFGITTKK